MGTIAVSVITLIVINVVSMIAFFLIMKSRFSRDRLLGELRAEVDRLVMDLGREADRDVAILESRIKNLRALMDEADRRILVAGKETARRKEETDILQNIAPQSAPEPSPQAARNPMSRPLSHPAAQPASVVASQYVPEAAQAGTRNEAPGNRPRAMPRDSDGEPVRIYTRPAITRSERQIEPFVPVQDRVLDMARRGFTAELIAGTLSMPLGEVELILDMNRSSL